MSELSEAFEEALDAAEDAKGVRETVLFRAEEVDALFGSNSEDYQPVTGGTGDIAPIRLSLRLTDVDPDPAPLEEITVRGTEMAVLSYTRLEGRIDIIAGDPAAEVS